VVKKERLNPKAKDIRGQMPNEDLFRRLALGAYIQSDQFEDGDGSHASTCFDEDGYPVDVMEWQKEE